MVWGRLENEILQCPLRVNETVCVPVLFQMLVVYHVVFMVYVSMVVYNKQLINVSEKMFL